MIGSLLFPVFKHVFNGDSEKAWRTVSIVPAVLAFITGVVVYFISDDSPNGNYHELKQHNTMEKISATKSFRVASMNRNTWVLSIQYACCFGVELTMNNAAALYFKVCSCS
jgi:NNP family nitrate/nitrite transporter-like MFS transporter